MWNDVTVFSGGDLTSVEKWTAFMRREYKIFDEESSCEAVEERKAHIKTCIERLQDELKMIDELATELYPFDEEADEELSDELIAQDRAELVEGIEAELVWLGEELAEIIAELEKIPEELFKLEMPKKGSIWDEDSQRYI